jgi:hypothetical protein
MPGLPGDDKILVGRNDTNLAMHAARGERLDFIPGNCTRRYAEVFEAVANLSAHLVRMLPDSAREDEQVEAAELRGQSANGLSYGTAIHRDGFVYMGVERSKFEQAPHIRTLARNTQKPSLLIDESAKS